MAKDLKKKIISLKLQLPYQHKGMQRRRKISMRSKGCFLLQQKCSTKFLNLLKLTLWTTNWVRKGHCFIGQKDTKHNKNVKYTEVKFVEAHFSSREAQCSWERCMVPFLAQQIVQNLHKLTQHLFREASLCMFWVVPGKVPLLWLPCRGLCSVCTLRGTLHYFKAVF